MAGQIKIVKRFDPLLVQNSIDDIFIFGDNLIKKGKAGQAIIRDCENVIGIPTKRLPSMNDNAFFSDQDDEMSAVALALDEITFMHSEGYNIVLPEDGVGTGYALLAEKSPKILEVIQNYMNELRAFATDTSNDLQVEVVHVKNYGKKSNFLDDEKTAMYVFCGRPSKLENPFIMEDESQRGTVIQSFSDNMPLSEINGLYDYCIDKGVKKLFLGCFCAPRACHCDVIKKQIIILEGKREK